MKSLIAILFSTVLLTGNEQLIKEAKIKLNLPGPEWFLADKQDNGKLIAYIFKREPITDSTGLHVIPNIAVILETIDPNTDIVIYSAMKSIKTPFKVESMFVHDDPKKEIDFSFVNAVGYTSEYTDSKGRPHKTYFIHAINGDKGIQIIFDSTTSVFDIADKEFRHTIKSVQKL